MVTKGLPRLPLLFQNASTAGPAEAPEIPMSDAIEAKNGDRQQVEGFKNERPPADVCAVCGRTNEEVGGRRLLTTISRAILVRENPPESGGRWTEIRAVRLEGTYHQSFVEVAGFSGLEEILAQARAYAQTGQTPWFCQRCAGQVCQRCGSLTREVPGSTFLADDGHTTYYAMLPIGNTGCSNPKCDKKG